MLSEIMWNMGLRWCKVSEFISARECVYSCARMCEYASVCIRVCASIHVWGVCISVRVCEYVCMGVCVFVYVCASMRVLECVYLCTCVRVCVYWSVCICVRVCEYACTGVCEFVYVCEYACMGVYIGCFLMLGEILCVR